MQLLELLIKLRFLNIRHYYILPLTLCIIFKRWIKAARIKYYAYFLSEQSFIREKIKSPQPNKKQVKPWLCFIPLTIYKCMSSIALQTHFKISISYDTHFALENKVVVFVGFCLFVVCCCSVGVLGFGFLWVGFLLGLFCWWWLGFLFVWGFCLFVVFFLFF